MGFLAGACVVVVSTYYMPRQEAWSGGGGNKIDSGALYRYADGGPEAAGISCAYL